MHRIERGRQLMAQNKIDAILMTGGTSLAYFTHIRWWLSERLFALVVPAKSAPFFVCPAFEEDRAREQIAVGPFDAKVELRLWQEDESPSQRVAQGLKDRGLSAGRLGIEKTLRHVYNGARAQAAPRLQITSPQPITTRP